MKSNLLGTSGWKCWSFSYVFCCLELRKPFFSRCLHNSTCFNEHTRVKSTQTRIINKSSMSGPTTVTELFACPDQGFYRVYNNFVRKYGYKQLVEFQAMDAVKRLGPTPFWQARRLPVVNSFREFRALPCLTYEEIKPWIQRLADIGDPSELFPKGEKVMWLSTTSGTTGAPKMVPVGSGAFRHAGKVMQMMDGQCMEDVGPMLKGSRYLKIGAIAKSKVTPGGLPRGPISSMLASNRAFADELTRTTTTPFECLEEEPQELLHLHALFALQMGDLRLIRAAFLYSVFDFLNYIKQNWQLLCSELQAGKLSESLPVSAKARAAADARLQELGLTACQSRAQQLSQLFGHAARSQGTWSGVFGKVWPDLLAVNANFTGSMEIYQSPTRECFGADVDFYNAALVGSEGTYGYCTAKNDPSYAYLALQGWFEFLPLHYSSGEIDPLHIKQIWEVEKGQEYEVIMTNPSMGLLRYRVGDVVRTTVTDTAEVPRLLFAYRTGTILSLGLERVTEQMTWEALTECVRGAGSGAQLMDYTARVDLDHQRYEFWIELAGDNKDIKDCVSRLQAGGCPTVTGAFRRVSTVFVQKQVQPAILYFVRPGTFHELKGVLCKSGLPPSQFKMPRTIKHAAGLELLRESVVAVLDEASVMPELKKLKAMEQRLQAAKL
eukprot:g75121.t1